MKIKRLNAVLTACAMLLLCACDKDNGESKGNGLNGADTAYSWSGVSIGGGGYIPGIICNEKEENLMYCRTDIGGAYRYDTAAGKWVALTDFFGADEWNYIGIESIATDNNEPNRVYMACGTYASTNGLIISSSDYGKTWKRFELDSSCGANMSGRGVGERLMIDPNDSRIIYFASRGGGLYKSDNYGESFSHVESFPVKGTYSQESNSVGLLWVMFDKSTGEQGKPTNDIYVGAAMTDGKTVYKSSDAGATWKAIDGTPAGMYPIQADISSNGKLYMTFCNSCGPNVEPTAGSVYAYDIKADSIAEITPQLEGLGNHGFGGVSVDDKNPDTLIVSTLGLYWPVKENFFYSKDGGTSWTPFYTSAENVNYTVDFTGAGWLESFGKNTLGWWVSDIEFNPFNSEEVFFGTGAALMKASGVSGVDKKGVIISSYSKGIEETAIFEALCPPDSAGSAQLYSIMGDLGGFVHKNVDEAPAREEIFTNSAQVPSDIDCGFKNSKVVVRCGSGSTTLAYSTDGGTQWFAAAPPAELKGGKDGSVAVSADGSSFIWAPDGVASAPFVTFDLGKTWAKCEGLTAKTTVIADRVNPLKFYATGNGCLFASEDGGKSFRTINTNVLESAVPLASSCNEGELWLTGTYLFHSTDGGATFTVIKGIKADCLGLGKGKDDGAEALYAMGEVEGKGKGIYRSLDTGATWQKINDDFHRFGNLTPSITGDPDIFGRVYFATNGRGIIMGDASAEK